MIYVVLLLFRLFFGDSNPLFLSSITIIETASNLSKLITPLTYLDNILSDNVNPDNIIPSNPAHFTVIRTLFSSSSPSSSSSSSSLSYKYIYSTFNTFKNNKKTIKICPSDLDDFCKNKELLSLVCNKLDYNIDPSSCIDENLPKKELLKIFNHTTDLEINTDPSYGFSLDSLISLINGTNIKRVIISECKEWISKVIESNEFKKGNWRFKYDGSGWGKLFVTLVE